MNNKQTKLMDVMDRNGIELMISRYCVDAPRADAADRLAQMNPALTDKFTGDGNEVEISGSGLYLKIADLDEALYG